MENEKSPAKMAKKLWKIVRIVLYMMRKGIARSNIVMVDLHMLLKKGKLASKAILGNIAMLHHHHHHCYSALTCRSDDINASFISPREYEFSCSNTPVYAFKCKNLYQREEELGLMNRVFDIINRFGVAEASSPPMGFRPSPVMRDWSTERHQIDSDAEEFINKFYRDLRNQRRIAAMESPSPYHICAR